LVALWLPVLLSIVAVLLFCTYQLATSRLEKEIAQKWSRPVEQAQEPEPQRPQPPIFLSTTMPTASQKHVALAMVIAMGAAFVAIVPFASVDGPRIPAVPPLGDALLFVMYFVIGFILLGQFMRLRSWSLLTLATGFFFQCPMVIMHAVTFPGFFVDNTAWTGEQTTSWVYVMWRSAFPIFLITYSYFHGVEPRRIVKRPTLTVVSLVTAAVVVPIGLVAGIVRYETVLPTIVVAHDPVGILTQYTHMLMSVLGPAILALNIIALIMLWMRGDSVLDVWLMVATCAAILDVSMASIIGNERFDVSWYAGRGFGLLSAGLVIGALLEEMNRLYASLYRMIQVQQLESEAKYQAIFDTTSDAIVVIDSVGNIKSFNRAAEKIMGYSAEEVIGHNVSILMPEPYHSAHNQYLKNYHATGIRKMIGIGREVLCQCKDGKILSIDLAVSEWRMGDEQLFTGILRNISDRKQMEQQLIQSQKMEAIGQLTGGMAHDFNNILGVVLGNLDMLSDHFAEAPEELIDAINAATTGADLVQRLLAFARRQPLQPKRIYLNEVVEEMLPLLRRIIGGQISIETFVDDNIWPVVADPTQFENVLLNLVINARDAMPNGGKLLIECRSHLMDEHSAIEYDVPIGTYTTLIVSDSGVGIPEDLLPRVFDPFFTTKPPGSGSGLGLSMVFGYTKQSGGVIRIYSEVGEGTSVRVYLPSAPNGDRDIEDTIKIDTANLHGTESILVVEDTTAARVVAHRILSSLGYTVRVASDASDALSIINSGEKFDMLFTDIVMPGMNGLELANIVRKQRPMMKVLFASGFSRTPTEEITALQATYITKPYRKLEIALLLRNIFAQRKP
jgi:PAS domain S-box-containing protein